MLIADARPRGSRGPRGWLPRARREAVALAPGLVAVAVALVLAADHAGYFPAVWYPWTLFLVALAAVALLAAPAPRGPRARSVWVALGGLVAFGAWGFLTIAWADARGDAWDGANRFLAGLAVFALLALRPARGRGAVALVAAWTLGVVGLALVTAGRLAGSADPLALFLDARLQAPAGYPNAAAATWLMAVWPAVLLAAARDVAWWLRGALAGGAVVLLDLAILAQSRGALLATPIVLVLVLALVPGRLRVLAVLVPVAGAVAALRPRLVDVFTRIDADRPARAAVAGLAQPVVLSALGVAALVCLVALLERDRPPSPRTAARIHRVAAVVACVVAVAGLGAARAAVGDPGPRLRSAWSSFKGYYATDRVPGRSRLGEGLGSGRYDFYRVSLDAFRAQPLTGTGLDNFAEDYLAVGRTDETPRYPHSWVVRTLAQTGLVGTLALLVGFAGALVASGRALRGADRLARAAAAGGLGAFAYWLVHGAVDWFWEIPGLAVPAFLGLGLAVGLAPGAGEAGRRPSRAARHRRRAAQALGGLAALGAALSLAAPWLAGRQVDAALREWPTAPASAFARLDRAAALNPLADRPELVAGAIALRRGELDRARRAFGRARRRNPRGAYATLQLGAIASAQGRRAEAKALLARARAASPRDPAVADALAQLRTGRPIDIAKLNRRIYERGRKFRR